MAGRLDEKRAAALLIVIPLAMGLALALMGRVGWCEAGDWLPWSWDVWSRHNSQHLIDPYSLSHIEHGIGLSLLLTLVSSGWLPVHFRTLIVAGVEATWEVVENTPFVIDRYREATISLDYFGDSIANSVGDYTLCLLGMLLARWTPWPVGVAAFALLEGVSLWWIRDGLVLNIVMLVAPAEAILEWQAK